jgi:predicted DNA-binding WGR domain protein
MDSPAGPPGDPIYLRWEHTTPPHRKFYEVEVELSLFYPKVLVRRWGRIGTRRARSIKLVLSEAEEVRREVEQVCRLRGRHGYRLVREVRVPAIGAEAA